MPVEPAHEETLSVEDCMALLNGQQLGRVVFEDFGQQLRPVNYVVVAGEIVFRMDRRLAEGRAVLFEIDQVDAVERQGWSVIVGGAAFSLDEGSVGAEVHERLAPWAPGDKASWTKIVIETINGRSVRAGRVRHQLDGRGYL